MKSINKKTLLWLGVFVLVGLYLYPVIKGRIAFANGRPAVNETAPDFTLTDLNGKRVTLSDFRGKVVLLNFWASWCPPCRMEIPGFQRFYEGYKNKGFVIIGLSLDDTGPSTVSSFVKKMGITYPIVMADSKVVRDYGNISAIPTSFLIDKNGRIVKKTMGMLLEGTLKGEVDSALNNRS